MRGYGQFCPVAMGAEVFAERWTPLIVRELLLGSHRFSELVRGVPAIPRSVLTARLAALESAGVVERRASPGTRGAEWWLTPAGLELGSVVEALGAWGYRHAVTQLPDDRLDPDLFLWFARRRLRLDRIPKERVVLEFAFTGRRPVRRWLVVDDGEVDLCIHDPGFEPDVVVSGDTSIFARIYLGHVDIDRAVSSGALELDGRRELVRAFPRWLGITHFTAYRDRAPEPAFGG